MFVWPLRSVRLHDVIHLRVGAIDLITFNNTMIICCLANSNILRPGIYISLLSKLNPEQSWRSKINPEWLDKTKVFHRPHGFSPLWLHSWTLNYDWLGNFSPQYWQVTMLPVAVYSAIIGHVLWWHDSTDSSMSFHRWNRVVACCCVLPGDYANDQPVWSLVHRCQSGMGWKNAGVNWVNSSTK